MGENHSHKIKIISAGEVASYVVCPEAWRLEKLNAVNDKLSARDRSSEGRDLHKRWANNLTEAHTLLVGVRVLLYLLVGAILTLIIVLR